MDLCPWISRPPDQGSFLGFRITEEGKIAMSEKSIEAFKARVRSHWTRQRSVTGKEVPANWQKYLRGWIGYYRLSERFRDWEDLEGWIRRHMRKWFWLRWHNGKGRANAFRRLKVRPCYYRLARMALG